MKLEEELKMQGFANSYQRAYLNIMFTANWLETHVQKILKPFNITTPQYNGLRILRGQKGNPMSAFAIQERMIHRTSNVTRILEKLVEKNLVTRESTPHNRRMIDVNLTNEGLQLLSDTDQAINVTYTEMSQVINPDQANILADWLDALREEISL